MIFFKRTEIELFWNKKMRPHLEKSLKEIKEFESMGFARSSQVLLHYVRNINDPYIKIFRSGGTSKYNKGSAKYTSKKIFGGRNNYIYDIRHKEKFIDFLVKTFLENNPDPDSNIRKAFTRVLHNNGLHWQDCYCQNK